MVRSKRLLHRQPHIPVQTFTTFRQQHEDVVAQEVCLSERDATRVQRFKDPVWVVVSVRGDFHDGETIKTTR